MFCPIYAFDGLYCLSIFPILTLLLNTVKVAALTVLVSLTMSRGPCFSLVVLTAVTNNYVRTNKKRNAHKMFCPIYTFDSHYCLSIFQISTLLLNTVEVAALTVLVSLTMSRGPCFSLVVLTAVTKNYVRRNK